MYPPVELCTKIYSYMTLQGVHVPPCRASSWPLACVGVGRKYFTSPSGCGAGSEFRIGRRDLGVPDSSRDRPESRPEAKVNPGIMPPCTPCGAMYEYIIIHSSTRGTVPLVELCTKIYSYITLQGVHVPPCRVMYEDIFVHDSTRGTRTPL